MFRRRLALVLKPGNYYTTTSSSFVLLLIMISLNLQASCSGRSSTNTSGGICPPSSCGNIPNISYPFRLDTDPKRCGELNYTLSCENNNTVLYLKSGKFYVKSINYHNYTIRLVDAGVFEQERCSIIPRFSLFRQDFDYYDDSFSADDPSGWGYINNPVIFLRCKNAATSKYNYVRVEDCNNSNFPNSSGMQYYWYVVVGAVNASTVMESCKIERISMVRLPPPPPDVDNWYHGRTIISMSYEEIHGAMLYGFELDWLNLICRKKCKYSWGCYVDRPTNSVHCYETAFSRALYEFLGWLIGTGLPFGVHGRCIRTLRSVLVICQRIHKRLCKHYLILGIGSFLALLQGAKVVFGAPFVYAFLIYKWQRRHLSAFDTIEEFLQNHNNLIPIRYSYKDIKKMTKGFRDKLGEGGFSSVYKGKLHSGRIAAIKMLGKSNANGQDFISEVATIGRIHHINIVQLIGFCAEGSNRALVYDFMPNGSLDKFILKKETSMPLSGKKLLDISLGVARGINYLHRGCDMQILHFDIKPHNILLDESFIPKISDFGLARLYPTNNNSIASLTAVRGTIGYIAPELFYKNIGPISHKADVYSFGMLLLEMTGKRDNLELSAASTSQIYFPFWVHDQVLKGNIGEIPDIIEEEMEITKKIVIVGLWCIQMKPNIRPPMSKVVEMLEGDLKSLELPPRPVLYPDETIGNFEETETSMTNESLESIASTSKVSNSSSYIEEVD